VEFARLCAERSRPTISSGGVRVLAVGRLVEKKSFDVLLDACARLRQRDISVGATIVGEPGEHGAVRQEQAARPEMAKSMAREAQTAISTRFNGDVTARTLSALLQEAVAC
jgi:glycosyltransferase involved in cell wall biosynthesis